MTEKGRADDAHEETLLWVRLPGLFSWAEVCSLFSNEAGGDRDWHFSVKLDTVSENQEPLYVVRAAMRNPAARAVAASDRDADRVRRGDRPGN
ncbi:MAG TPA: hypothetical protein VHE30_14910 [Polyangiaceae bacterium]|nr:hypothetical protein [Polyangiaceae bacterium]